MKNNLNSIWSLMLIFGLTTSYFKECLAQNILTQSISASSLSSESNAVSFKPELWPDGDKKRHMLEHSAELLKSAIDTNRIEQIKQACNNLTNQSDVIIGFKHISDEAVSTLFETAVLLTSGKLNTTSWNGGYTADIPNPADKAEVFYYVFDSENGPINQLEIDSSNDGKVLARAIFFENGKLKTFEKFKPDNEILAFKQDGTLAVYSVMTNNFQEESLQYDAMTNLVVRHQTWKNLMPKQ